MHAKLSKETILHVAKNMTGLTELDVTGGFVGAFGAKCLAEALSRKPTNLTSLVLANNSIGCTGCISIATMLSMNECLTNLDLSSNDIQDRGADAISRCLKKNDTLSSIRIGDNPIGEDSVKKLMRTARSCDNIQSVKGCDQLLAPIALRRMVENNSEGRENNMNQSNVDNGGEETGLEYDEADGGEGSDDGESDEEDDER